MRAVFEPALNWKNWRVPRAAPRFACTRMPTGRGVGRAEANKAAARGATPKRETKYIDRALEKELAKFEPPLAARLSTAFHTPAPKRTAEQKAAVQPLSQHQHPAGHALSVRSGGDRRVEKATRPRSPPSRPKVPTEEFLRVLTEVPAKTPVTYLFYRGDYPAAQAGDRRPAT